MSGIVVNLNEIEIEMNDPCENNYRIKRVNINPFSSCYQICSNAGKNGISYLQEAILKSNASGSIFNMYADRKVEGSLN